MKTLKFSVLSLLALSVVGCSGIKRSGNQFTVHAESFNLLTLQIPKDDYQSAISLIPKNAEVHTVRSNPSDLESFSGIVNRILGIGYTEISGIAK
jgi:hypothetical protein